MNQFTPGLFNDTLLREPDRCQLLAIEDDVSLGASMELLGLALRPLEPHELRDNVVPIGGQP